MAHPLKTLFLILLAWQCLRSVGAQERGYMEHYSTDQGLSDDFVTAIVQDIDGSLWVGTQNGLCRFDGRGFRTLTTANYPSLYRNDISSLSIDPTGHLLSASRNSVIVRYDRTMDTFEDISITDIYGTEYASILRLSLQQDDALYALTTSGLYRYSAATARFSNRIPALDSTTRYHVQDLYIDALSRYWIATSEGIRVLDSTGAEYGRLFEPRSSKSGHFCFCTFSDSIVFIGTVSDGLWMANTFLPLSATNPQRVHTPFADVSCFLSSAEKCYIGTRSQGLWSVDKGIGQLSAHSFASLYAGIKAVNTMCEDRKGDIWLGTQGAGLYRYRTIGSRTVVQSRHIGFPQVVVSSFVQDSHGQLWVGTDGDGIYVLSPDYQIVRHIDMSSGLTSNGVLSLAYGREAVWATTWGGGVCKIDRQGGKVEAWTAANSAMPINNSKSVCITREGEIWVGTHGEGISQLDSTTGDWISHRNGSPREYALQPAPWVNQVIEGTGGDLWVASIRNVWHKKGGELQMVLSDTGSLPQKNPLFVHAIATDSAGCIYTATNRGIYRISSDGSHVSMPAYIPRGEYFSVLFDTKSRCWMAGADGVSYVEAGGDAVHRISLPSATLRGNYFTPRAAYISAQGRIFLGAADGYISFHPDSLPSSGTVDNISFSDIYIASERQLPGSDFLPQHISCMQSITLAHHRTNVRIAFDIVNMSYPEDVHTSYMLAPIDRQWTRTGDEREVSFSQIPPGEYTLYVKAWRGTDESLAETVSLNITVMPPWWERWWFIIISSSATMLIIAGFIRMRFNRILAQKLLLESQVSERTHELRSAYQSIHAQNISLGEHQLALELKNEELSRTLSTKDRLLSVVAHDLKNPMFAIVSLLEILQRHFDEYDRERRLKFVANALDSARLLQSEMVKLLEWATLQQRDQVFQPQEVSVGDIINSEVSLMRQTADNKGVELRYDQSSVSHIFADARMVSAVVRNLIGNALKFTPKSGTVSVTAVSCGATVHIQVTDTGIGMSQEQLASLFDPDIFVSNQGTRGERGSGLGLKICHEFVLKNNGTLEAESTLGCGSSFTVTLPAAASALQETNASEAMEQEADQVFVLDPALLEGNTVLIVDDNAAVRQLLNECIGHYTTVLEACDGAQAYSIALELQPDVILSDVDMPEMDGIILCRKLAQNNATAHIPVVMLTARSELQYKLAGLHSGAVDYLTKPFDQSELLMKLSNILTVRRHQQQKLIAQAHEQTHLPDEIHPFVLHFLEVLEQNYRNADLSIDELARLMAMSKTTLWRRLSSIIDKTPIELLNEHRLGHARSLLKMGNLNVSEVAYEVGYSDPRYFSRKFKEFFGLSPSEV